MPEKLFDVPNLDDMSVDPQDYDTAENVFRLLKNYSLYKRLAMQCRVMGHIKVACIHEDTLTKIYAQLPEWARW